MPLLTVLLALAAAPGPTPVTAEALRARYAGLARLSADVTQTKEGRYWTRPLVSHVRLACTPGRIVWETVDPVRSTVVVENGRLTVRGPDGAERSLGAAAADPRLGALLHLLGALLSVDLPGVERDFALEFGDGVLVARPRPGGAAPLFQALRLQFDAGLELTAVDLETASERTHLVFSHVSRERARPDGGAP